MIVTQIKQIGKSENYKIYLDESYALTLNMLTIYKNSLRVGDEIEKEGLEKMQFESEKIIAFDRAINLLSRASKTAKDMKTYLKGKGYSQSICDYVVEKLEGYKYIDDKRYAEDYVESVRKRKGPRVIKQQLLLKGISSNIIDSALEGLNQKKEVLVLAEKYMKNKEKTPQVKQKLYRHLMTKGFNYDECKSAISKAFEGDEDDWYWYFRKSKNKRSCKKS